MKKSYLEELKAKLNEAALNAKKSSESEEDGHMKVYGLGVTSGLLEAKKIVLEIEERILDEKLNKRINREIPNPSQDSDIS